MARKTIKMDTSFLPFDKSKSAAEQMLGGVTPESGKDAENAGSKNLRAEAQKTRTVKASAEKRDVKAAEADARTSDASGTKKSPKRTFPGKQHIHLILDDRQADMVKMLAKHLGISINQFMSQTIDNMYEREWKDTVAEIADARKKMGIK